MSHQEIERKFLLDRLPPIPAGAEVWQIEQGYLSDGTGRLRRVTNSDGAIVCTHTTKTGQGLVRQENERTISEREFGQLWPQTEGRRLKKTRHRMNDGHLVWEIDEFHELELVLAEVELPSADASAEFSKWLAPHVVREVTDDPSYTNAAIAERIG